MGYWKSVTCIIALFTPFNCVNFTLPVSFTKLHLETIEWEERRFFEYMAASPFHFISTEIENHIFKHIFSLDTILLYVFMNNPHYWQSSEATAGIHFVLTIYHCHNLCTYISQYKRYHFSYRCYACFGYNLSDLVSSRLASLSHHIFEGSCNCNLKEKINIPGT